MFRNCLHAVKINQIQQINLKKNEITFVHKQQLSLVYVCLGKVEHWPHGGVLQSKVSIAWWSDHEVQLLCRSIQILCSQILSPDFCH